MHRARGPRRAPRNRFHSPSDSRPRQPRPRGLRSSCFGARSKQRASHHARPPCRSARRSRGRRRSLFRETDHRSFGDRSSADRPLGRALRSRPDGACRSHHRRTSTARTKATHLSPRMRRASRGALPPVPARRAWCALRSGKPGRTDRSCRAPPIHRENGCRVTRPSRSITMSRRPGARCAPLRSWARETIRSKRCAGRAPLQRDAARSRSAYPSRCELLERARRPRRARSQRTAHRRTRR